MVTLPALAAPAINERLRILLAITEQGVKDADLRGRVSYEMRRRKPATVAEAETVYAEVVSARLLDGTSKRKHAKL